MLRKNKEINKSKFLIVFSIVLCIICFINNWFKDEIIARIFIFSIIIDLLLLILLAIFFKRAVTDIKEKNKKGYISLVILIIAVILSIVDFRFVKTKLELNLYMNKRLEIIDMVKDNKLDYYYEGNIKLPKYKYVSQDGEIYVYQNDNEQVIAFWIFRGIQSGSIQLFYSTGGEELIRNNETNHQIKKVTELKENWYYVETNY